MSRRNPITGKRRKPKPGDRCQFILPEGPPVMAIEAFGGDIQAATVAALTLLYLQMQSAGVITPRVPEVDSEPLVDDPPIDPLANVMAQELYG